MKKQRILGLLVGMMIVLVIVLIPKMEVNAATSYTDLKPWQDRIVQFYLDNGYLEKTSDRFGPNDVVTNRELARVFYNTFKKYTPKYEQEFL